MRRNKCFFKWLSALLSLIPVMALSGCGTAPTGAGTENAGTLPADSGMRSTKEAKMAVEMVQAIFSQYAINGKTESLDFINLREYHDKMQSGYLWSNFCGVGMQYYMCKLYPDDAEQKEVFRKMINNFLCFRQSRPESLPNAESGADTEANRNTEFGADIESSKNTESSADTSPVKYHSARGTVAGLGSGDCFFDDNIWVARNYLRAYEILGDEWYLEEAIRVNNWVLSGWNEELGGVVWSEAGLAADADAQHLERGLSANACSIIVNAMLSQLAKTPEESRFYLEWAERFYEFCKKMQNTPESYDYWNGIHTVYQNGTAQNGDINRVHYSYNSGSMILANLVLYDCAEEEEKKSAYLHDALKTAEAADKTFRSYDAGAGCHYYQGDPWFAAILNEAYYELWQHGQASASSYLEFFAENVAAAYSNREEETGLCPYQATGKVTWNNNESYVIHQVGFAEQAVLAALYSVHQQESSREATGKGIE